jgi:hypothetical protein
MKTKNISLILIGVTLSIFLALPAALALGADHPNQVVSSSVWPKGMSALVNSPERVHGYFVNSGDVFFFAGDQKQFSKFLQDYAKIEGLVTKKIVVHDGIGRAKSPWKDSEGSPCDWMINGCPASWKQADADAKGYILEIHVWKGGAIKIEKDKLPVGILVETAMNTEQDGADQPATAPESKAESNEKTKPESEVRPQ